MTDRTFINALAPNQLIDGIFSIQNCQLGLTRNGKPYLKALIADKTGRLPARMWNASEELVSTLPTDGFVMLDGQTQPYQGELQVIINHIEPARPEPKDLTDLLPSTEHDIEQMFKDLSAMLHTIASPSVRALAETYLQDAKLMEAFKISPAAVTLHHAYLGGLLEHTLHLMQLAEAMLPLYPQLNRDIVLMGLFIHDIGKCAELSWQQGFQYTDQGHLVGHIAQGSIWLEQKAAVAAKVGHALPPEARMVLQHIILSHHGKPEFGAQMPPSTPEALFVSQLDNLEAKMQMAIDPTRGRSAPLDDVNGNFTEKLWALENRRFYRPDPLAGEAPSNPA